MDITSWVDWCAVLGFGLSLALAIAELLRRRKRLAVSLAKAVFAGEGDLWCNLFLTITNQSSVAISINTIYLRAGKRRLPLDDSRVAAFSVTRQNSKSAAYSDRPPTRFPVFLQPYESRAILLNYIVPQSTHRAFRLPSAHIRREPAQNVQWACQIDLATSRGSTSLPISAKVVSPDAVFDVLLKECEAIAVRDRASDHSSHS